MDEKHFPEPTFGKVGSTFGLDLETGEKVHMFRGIVIGECLSWHVYLVAFPIQEYVGFFTDREDITDFGVEGEISFMASDFKIVTGYVQTVAIVVAPTTEVTGGGPTDWRRRECDISKSTKWVYSALLSGE